jgi:predicted SAM-dependent methyltransferase
VSADLRLHLGCGSTVVPGWKNIDRSPNVLLSKAPRLRSVLGKVGVLTQQQAAATFPTGIIYADVRRRIPFPDGVAQFVYSSHMIEHMVRADGIRVMREAARVLAPGGILRIATPDLEALVEGYRTGYAWEGMTPADTFMHAFGSASTPSNTMRRLAHQAFTHPHQWLYDGCSLTRLFEDAGFVDVRRTTFRESAIPGIEEIEHREQSLFVEGRRP